MRQPVMAEALETPLSTMVRPYKSGQAFRMFTNGCSVQRMCSYMSSVAISTLGCRRSTSPSAELLAGVGDTGRVRRAVDDHEPSHRRDGCLELRRRDLEFLLNARINDDGYAVGQHHHVRVGDPVGRGDDDLVARIQQGLHQI